MVPLIEAVVNSYIMDWATILSDKMARKILYYRKNRFLTIRIIPPFFMSAYIIDTVCFNSEFPILDWKWTQSPILSTFIINISGNPIINATCTGFFMDSFYKFINLYIINPLRGYLMRPTLT